ncbi:MAG: ArsR family transcriptional regulator [Labilithrix sp.]|nr:ArsR family transcriptional regulator [Labilithrix sp.]
MQLLMQLRDRPMTTAELAEVVGRHKSLVTQQLRVLRIVRLVRRVRRGNVVRYEVHDARAEALLAAFVRDLARRSLRPRASR